MKLVLILSSVLFFCVCLAVVVVAVDILRLPNGKL